MSTLSIEESKKQSQEKREANPVPKTPSIRIPRPEGLTANIPALLASIHWTEEEISAHKKVMRASGHNVTAPEVWRLVQLKYEATRFCVLAARLHGRLHLPLSICALEDQDRAAFDAAKDVPVGEKKEVKAA